MPLTNKTYTFEKANEKVYNIDSYNITNKSSIIIENNGNVILNNTNANTNTNNFYGDGRLGKSDIRVDTNVNPACFYFENYQPQHAIYGSVLWNAWESFGTLNIGDELILYKRHAISEEFVDECGDWELCTIKEIINDNDGIHYTLNETLIHDYTNNTANSSTLVLQYETLELFDNMHFSQYYAFEPVEIPWWSNLEVSSPKGIMFIKATDEITIGDNSIIWSEDGNIGAKSYKYTSTTYDYYFGGSKLGTGRLSTSTYADENLRDTRSATTFGIYNASKTPGMPGIDGMSNADYSTASNRDAVSTDLNNKIYLGIGGATEYSDTNTNHSTGYSGGGIVIIQSPKITFKTGTSQISAASSGRAIVGHPDNMGGGGSILLKCEEMHFLSPGLVTSGDSSIDVKDYVNSNITTSRTHTDDSDVKFTGLPGHIQIECTKFVLEGVEKTKDEFVSLAKDYIYDMYLNEHFTLNDILNGMSAYPEVVKRIEEFEYMSPIYETGSYFKIGTSGLLNVDINEWYNIEEILTDFRLFPDTEIKVVFSNDTGSSWYYFDMSSTPVQTSTTLSDSDLSTKSNTIEELISFVNEPLLTASIVNPQRGNDNRQIDVVFALKTNISYKTPILKNLYFTYNRIPIPLAPIPINPYDGEEFDNEYVDFVWLQPEQKYGSIQNRLQITTTPNFESNKQSYLDGEVLLSYESDEYVNQMSAIRNFTPPIMTERTIPSSTYADSISPSLEIDGTTLIYSGDEYIIEGKNLVTSSTSVTIPTTMDFREITTRSTTNELTGHILFGQNMSVSDFDEIGNYKLTSIADDLLDSTYYGIQKKIGLNTEYIFTAQSGTSVLNASNDFTMSYRFKQNNNTSKSSYPLFYLNTGTISKFYVNIEGHYVDLSIDNNYRFENPYFHSLRTTDSYMYAPLIYDDLENVIVIKYNSVTGTVSTYLNGYFIYDADYVIGDSTEVDDTIIGFGASTGAAEVTPIEFCIYDSLLTNDEILTISKIPVYDIRYNLITNSIEFNEVMSTKHLSKIESILEDDIPQNTSYTTAWSDLRKSYRTNLYSRCYANTEISLKLGTLVNNELMLHNQEPLNNYIMGYRYYPDLNYSSISQTNFKENTSFSYNNSKLIDRGMHGTNKIDYFYTNLSVSFKTNDITKTWRVGHGFSGNVERHNYEGFVALYYLKHDGVTGITNFVVYDFTTENSYKEIINIELPFRLGDNHIYSLKGYLDGEIWRFALLSETDSNYINEVEIANNTQASYTRKAYGTATDDIRDTTRAYGETFLCPRLYDYRAYNEGFEPISAIAYLDVDQTKKTGYSDVAYRDIKISGVNIQKINRIYTRYSSLSPEATVSYFFKIGDIWSTFNFTTNEWEEKNEKDYTQAMSFNDVLKLSEYEFKRAGGVEYGTDFTVRFILSSTNNIYSPLVEEIYIDYNGPETIDSWISDESNYTGIKFYYSKDWNVYENPDFGDANQGWIEMGSGIPDTTVFVDGNGSRPSQDIIKYFGGARILLTPKGKYYWRVAAYNGV